MGLGVARVQDTAPHLTERAYGASVLYRFAVTPEVPSKLKHPPSALDHLRSKLAELEHVRNQSFTIARAGVYALQAYTSGRTRSPALVHAHVYQHRGGAHSLTHAHGRAHSLTLTGRLDTTGRRARMHAYVCAYAYAYRMRMRGNADSWQRGRERGSLLARPCELR